MTSTLDGARSDTAPADAIRSVLGDRRWLVLTGAGVSTDSGIPDYRGPGAPVRRPMTIADFRRTDAARQRYWARAFLGWSAMGTAAPNATHHMLAAMQADGRLSGLITQNVDGLHERAGQQQLVALHGRISDVVCLDCGGRLHRTRMQQRLAEANPDWLRRHGEVVARPDGDVELEETAGFVVPACEGCGGRLKPDVVFFGENVPTSRVERCYAAVDALSETDGALLVAGSSLAVMSGFRFVRRAAKAGTPVVIVNRGATRADDLAAYRLEAGTSEFLTALAAARSGTRSGVRSGD